VRRTRGAGSDPDEASRSSRERIVVNPGIRGQREPAPADLRSVTGAPGATWLDPRARDGGRPKALDSLWSRSWMVVVAIILALLVALAYVKTAPRVYQAQAQLIVNPLPSDTATGVPVLVRESVDPSRDIATVSRLIATPEVARRAIGKLRLDSSPDALLHRVSALPVAQSNLIAVTADAGSAEEATAIANAIAVSVVDIRTARLHQALNAQIPRLETRVQREPPSGTRTALEAQIADLRSLREEADPTVQVATPATPPEGAYRPRPLLSAAAAVVAGTVLGVLAVFAAEFLDTRLGGEDQLRRTVRLPLLARIPRTRSRLRRSSGPLVPWRMTPAVADSFRALQVALGEGSRRADGSGRSILIAGSSAGEGKTSVALNLAWSLAQSGDRVILIEADDRRPVIAKALELGPGPGLETVVSQRAALEDVLRPVELSQRRLSVLASEQEPGRHRWDAPSRAELEELLGEVNAIADWVIVDVAPLNRSPVALLLAELVDDVVLVVRPRTTVLQDLLEVAEALGNQHLTPEGVVLVGAKPRPAYRH
jgi:succinoglycan biosynthesis transport protein ExoP